MMTALSELLDYRSKLMSARFSGVREFRDSNGETVSYRSQAEIERAIAALDSEISKMQGGRNQFIRFQTSKGL